VTDRKHTLLSCENYDVDCTDYYTTRFPRQCFKGKLCVF